LDDVTFRCEAGQVHSLLGQNGAGKSTLMKILAGVYPPDSGDILLGGAKVKFSGPHEAQALGISIIHQELNLLPDLSVAANVFLGREPAHTLGLLNATELENGARQVLQRLGVDIDPRERVANLSIAQQQMVEIAKALSVNARVVIMDEPSATLGSKELEHLFEVIAALKSQGVAIIYISHRLSELYQVADWVTVFRDGRLVDSRSLKDLDRTALVRMMIGSSTFTEQFPPRSEQIGPEVLRVEGLSSPPLLHEINLSVHAGEIVGIAGLMGSGRSELAQVVFGVRKVTAGSIFLGNQPVRFTQPHQAIDRAIAYLPESRKEEGLVMGLSVRQNAALASLKTRQKRGFVRRRAEQEAVSQAAKRLNVKTPTLEQEVERLSGGNQQKVAIAKWLMTKPQLLIFDEPTRGVDVAAKVEIWKLIRELADQGTAILMISSELPEVIGMSDRILVLHKGRIVGELPGPDASEEAILSLASFGDTHDQRNA
jgi:ribose transport system ATP-binding protein